MGFEENWSHHHARKGPWSWVVSPVVPEVPLAGEWDWFSGDPGIATATDGRLAIFDNKQVLIMPAPAAEIYTSIKVRRCAR